jgi:hypothetical protein
MIGFSESSKCAQICKVSDILYITFRVDYSIVNKNIWKGLFETLSHLLFLCCSAPFFFSPPPPFYVSLKALCSCSCICFFFFLVIPHYIEFVSCRKIQVFEDAYKSQFSIIVLDDIERYLSP